MSLDETLLFGATINAALGVAPEGSTLGSSLMKSKSPDRFLLGKSAATIATVWLQVSCLHGR